MIVFEEYNFFWHHFLSSSLTQFPHVYPVPLQGNFGIAIYSKYPISDLKILQMQKTDPPSVTGTIQLGTQSIRLIATHPMPPMGKSLCDRRNQQLIALGNLIATVNDPVLLIGDLNTSSYSAHFKILLEKSKLKDSRLGFGIQPTWPVGLSFFSIPLDHVLLSNDLHVLERTTGEDIGSDHLPVNITIGTSQ